MLESSIRTFTVFDGRLFYVLKAWPQPELLFHYELWAYDGANAQKIANLSAESASDYRFDLGVFKGALYFNVVAPMPGGYSYEHQSELWMYDGQSEPKKIATLAGPGVALPVHFQAFEDWLYFSAVGTLYRYNGAVLQDVGASSSTIPEGPTQLSLYATRDMRLLYLTGFFNDWRSREPYFFNGAEASLIKNIMPDNAPYPYQSGSFPTVATQVGNRLYFLCAGRRTWLRALERPATEGS